MRSGSEMRRRMRELRLRVEAAHVERFTIVKRTIGGPPPTAEEKAAWRRGELKVIGDASDYLDDDAPSGVEEGGRT